VIVERKDTSHLSRERERGEMREMVIRPCQTKHREREKKTNLSARWGELGREVMSYEQLKKKKRVGRQLRNKKYSDGYNVQEWCRISRSVL